MRYFFVTILALSLLCLQTSLQAEEILLSSIQGQTEAIHFPSLHADLVVVEKSARRLTLFKDRKSIRTYIIALGRSPKGAKYKQVTAGRPKGSIRSTAV